MINFDINGDKKLYAYLGDFSARTVSRIDNAIVSLTQQLSRNAIRKASGGVLNSKSGALVAAIRNGSYVVKSGGRIKGVVGVAGASKKVAIYAGAQEYGATIKARILEAKNVSKLRFEIGGKFIFAKQVKIPEVKIPAHSFLRSALREISGEAKTAIANAARVSAN